MTRTELKALVTSLLDNYELDDSVFEAFLDTAQAIREGHRPWVALRAEDSTQSISTSNTFETEKSLPTDFRKWYTRFPVVLTDANGNPMQYLAEVPIHMKTAYKDEPSRFYCNYRTSKLYLCGKPGTSLTVRQYYIRRATKISAAAANTWELDPNDEYTKILGFDVAALWKRGIDYDVISNPQGDAHAAAAAALFKQMEEWDAELQESALQGQTYGNPGTYFGADGLSGRLSGLE